MSSDAGWDDDVSNGLLQLVDQDRRRAHSHEAGLQTGAHDIGRFEEAYNKLMQHVTGVDDDDADGISSFTDMFRMMDQPSSKTAKEAQAWMKRKKERGKKRKVLVAEEESLSPAELETLMARTLNRNAYGATDAQLYTADGERQRLPSWTGQVTSEQADQGWQRMTSSLFQLRKPNPSLGVLASSTGSPEPAETDTAVAEALKGGFMSRPWFF